MPKNEKAYRLSVGLLLITISLMACESILFMPAQTGFGSLMVVLLIKLLPLLAFLPGLLARRIRTTTWMCFVLLIYLVIGVLYSFQPGVEGSFALIRTLLLTTLFTSSLFFIRWEHQATVSQ